MWSSFVSSGYPLVRAVRAALLRGGSPQAVYLGEGPGTGEAAGMGEAAGIGEAAGMGGIAGMSIAGSAIANSISCIHE
jgi:hypothetical protein